MNETANFYPGLTIETSAEVEVLYAYGSTTGLVPPDSLQTIYAPLGTDIVLAANPTSFIYAFGGWSGGIVSSASEISMTVNSPSSLSASYTYNFVFIDLVIATIIIAVIIIIIIVVVFASKRLTYIDIQPMTNQDIG
jgi:hypothetical protein